MDLLSQKPGRTPLLAAVPPGVRANRAAAPGPLLSPPHGPASSPGFVLGSLADPAGLQCVQEPQLRLFLVHFQLLLVRVCMGVFSSPCRPLKVAVSTYDPAVLDWGHCLLLDVPKLEPETKLISPPSPKLHTHTHM